VILSVWLLGCGHEAPGPDPQSLPPPPPSVSQASTQPARLTGPWQALGGTEWLLPGLEALALTVADQPVAGPERTPPGAAPPTAGVRTRTFTVSTSAERLRSPGPGPSDLPRVIALGDGATFGWGLDAEQAWPALLHQALDGQAQVLNAGVPGAQPRDLAAWCEAHAPALTPSVIVWSVHPHPNDRPPFTSAFNSIRRCSQASGAAMVVAPPPTSSFDLKRQRELPMTTRLLAQRTAQAGHAWLDLTATFAGQPGPRLVRQGSDLVLRDAEGGMIARTPDQGDELPDMILRPFWHARDLSEPGFIDQWHPDARGHQAIAHALVPLISPLLDPQALTP